MPRFSPASQAKLRTCDDRLQRVFAHVIQHVDCTVLDGHRDQAAQMRAVKDGLSKLEWPASPHNKKPSRAIDVIRFPIDWEDTEGHILFAGFVLGIAAVMGIKLRWGGDWNRDFTRKGETFADLVHFELVG